MTHRLRTDRMRRHIPGWTERSRAELEALLREAFAGPKHVLLSPLPAASMRRGVPGIDPDLDMSVADLFFDPALVEQVAKGAIVPRGWLKRLSRRITRKNGASS